MFTSRATFVPQCGGAVFGAAAAPPPSPPRLFMRNSFCPSHLTISCRQTRGNQRELDRAKAQKLAEENKELIWPGVRRGSLAGTGLMIVHDFYSGGSEVRPDETEAVVIVKPNGVRPLRSPLSSSSRWPGGAWRSSSDLAEARRHLRGRGIGSP